MKEQYGIKFYKYKGPYNSLNFSAEADPIENRSIAAHLSYSNIPNTEDQIEELRLALNGEKFQKFWGEVLGSTLEIYIEDNTVQVGYTNRRIPIQDFKELLEEWLIFLTG